MYSKISSLDPTQTPPRLAGGARSCGEKVGQRCPDDKLSRRLARARGKGTAAGADRGAAAPLLPVNAHGCGTSVWRPMPLYVYKLFSLGAPSSDTRAGALADAGARNARVRKVGKCRAEYFRLGRGTKRRVEQMAAGCATMQRRLCARYDDLVGCFSLEKLTKYKQFIRINVLSLFLSST